MAQWMSWWILNPCVPGSNLGNRMIFFFVDFFIYLFFYVFFFLSLLLQYKFANSTLLSLLSFSYFITPYDAQASSAFSALIFITSGPELCLHINCLQSCLGKERSLRARILFQYLPKS